MLRHLHGFACDYCDAVLKEEMKEKALLRKRNGKFCAKDKVILQSISHKSVTLSIQRFHVMS